MLRPSPNHGTQRLPNDDDGDATMMCTRNAHRLFVSVTLSSSLLAFVHTQDVGL